MIKLSLVVLAMSQFSATPAWAELKLPGCEAFLSSPEVIARYVKAPSAVLFDFPGVQIASLSDPTLSTGATLFYFPKGGAETVVDARGGSVSSSETTLLTEGGYSNNVDGIFFAGGSTMGLAAGDGVRAEIFKRRAEAANSFDSIPSVPGAVVFDFGGRIAPFNDGLVYPDRELGQKLMSHLSSDTFYAGRFGAGTTTTFGKLGKPRWGGQGMKMVRLGPYRVLCAVALNAAGSVYGKDGQEVAAHYRSPSSRLAPPSGGRQNTTLSVVLTDAPLNRDQLKRLAVMVHTSMAAWIRPFHTSTDGDILFASSVHNDSPDGIAEDRSAFPEDMDLILGEAAAGAMRDAIFLSIQAANDPH